MPSLLSFLLFFVPFFIAAKRGLLNLSGGLWSAFKAFHWSPGRSLGRKCSLFSVYLDREQRTRVLAANIIILLLNKSRKLKKTCFYSGIFVKCIFKILFPEVF